MTGYFAVTGWSYKDKYKDEYNWFFHCPRTELSGHQSRSCEGLAGEPSHRDQQGISLQIQCTGLSTETQLTVSALLG